MTFAKELTKTSNAFIKKGIDKQKQAEEQARQAEEIKRQCELKGQELWAKEFAEGRKPELERAAMEGKKDLDVKEISDGIGYDKNADRLLGKAFEEMGLQVRYVFREDYYAGYRHQNPDAKFMNVYWE